MAVVKANFAIGLNKTSLIMAENIIQIVLGSILMIELIYCIVRSKIAAEYIWYICRPFGIPFSMGVGAIVRLFYAEAAGILFYRGIIGLI